MATYQITVGHSASYTLNFRDVLAGLSGGVASGVVVNDGGTVFVSSGGGAQATMFNSGGTLDMLDSRSKTYFHSSGFPNRAHNRQRRRCREHLGRRCREEYGDSD